MRPEIARLAEVLAARIPGAAAVLFYGSNLRSGDLEGVLDFYVLTDRPRSLLDRLLPPTVMFVEAEGLCAKVGVMPLKDFGRAMRPRALSPHLWARFCQPAVLAWVRDEAAAAQVGRALDDALWAAAWWAARLAPPGADTGTAWAILFRHTYAAELRAEGPRRPEDLMRASPRWPGLPPVDDAERNAARRAWRRRIPLGKALAALRLVKAAFTVQGGADYIAWKIERHTGHALGLTPWQRRHPLLAALPVLIRLRRSNIIR
jgi:hypothetical protein